MSNSFNKRLDEILERTHLEGRRNPKGYGKALKNGAEAIRSLVQEDK